MKNRIKDYLVLLFISIILVISLMNSNFDLYKDDGIQHVARLMGVYQSIEEGQLFPVIMSNFCNGFGYSWNLFYSPFTAYVPLLFHLFTDSFELILKLFMWLTIFASGIAMYEFTSKVTKNRLAGVLAGCLYMLAPYHLTDVYMRIAVSELASFVFVPIVFQGMYNIFHSFEQNKNEEDINRNILQDTKENLNFNKSSEKRGEKLYTKSLVLTLGAVGLVLSHIVIAMYTAIICFIYVLVNVKKLKDTKILKMLGINILLILLLCSFYLVPMLEHYFSTDYEVFQAGRMERTEELIRNKVDFIDLLYTGQDEMSFEIGLVTIIGVVLTLLTYKKIGKEYKTIYWFSLITGMACIILSLRIFPFEKMPAILKMIQFTFRFLEFSSFFLAWVAAINYALTIKKFQMRDVFVLTLIATLLLVPLKKNYDTEKEWTEEKLWPAVSVNENTGRVHAGCATFEYLPSKAFANLDYIKQRENTAIVISGKATIENEEKQGTNMQFAITETEETATIELPYIYYLGYKVTLQAEDGSTKELPTFESDNGFVAFEIAESEKGQVTANYTGTTLMQITYIVSGVTLLGIVIVLLILKIVTERD